MFRRAIGIPSTSHLKNSLYHSLGVVPLNSTLVSQQVSRLIATHAITAA